MKLRTLIIDDEPIALEKLRKYVEKTAFLELAGACSSGTEALALLAEESVDVIFTDINMPDLSGLDMVRSLAAPPLVVLITAYSEYGVESYSISAVDYLLKPYGMADFQRAANKVLDAYRLRHPEQQAPAAKAPQDSIFIKADYKYVRIELNRIRYIRGYGEYLRIYLEGETAPVLTLSSFQSIMELLPGNFLQVHRSYIVNMEKVTQVGRNRILLGLDEEIPVGEASKPALQEYLSRRTL